MKRDIGGIYKFSAQFENHFKVSRLSTFLFPYFSYNKSMSSEDKKIKILYLITKSNWGGAQVYLYSLATTLPRDKYDVLVLHGGEGLLSDKLNKAGIQTIKIDGLDRDIKLGDEIKVFFKLIKIFKEEKPDIIHVNSSKIAGLGSLTGRLAGIKKIIFTAHGWPFNEDRSFWQKTLILMLSYLTTVLTHKTIVIAQKELDQTKNWPFVQNKINFIYNGIPKIDFLSKDEAQNLISKKIGFENKKNILWIGTISELTKNKGLEYAINAINKLKKDLNEWNGIFVIIGSNGEEKENIKNLIKGKKLEKNIFIAGFIENASKYLKAFDIFLLSSVKEGFPYALLEAGQSGNATVSTRVGGTGEIIDNLENGILIHPKREKEIANAIRFYMENPEKMALFGTKLESKIKLKFSIEKMVEKTFKLYN